MSIVLAELVVLRVVCHGVSELVGFRDECIDGCDEMGIGHVIVERECVQHGAADGFFRVSTRMRMSRRGWLVFSLPSWLVLDVPFRRGPRCWRWAWPDRSLLVRMPH